MIKTCELHILHQIYDFLSEREGSQKKTPNTQVIEFFKELNIGDQSEFVLTSPSTVYGNFGRVSKVSLSNAPLFREKDKFIKWAYAQIQ